MGGMRDIDKVADLDEGGVWQTWMEVDDVDVGVMDVDVGWDGVGVDGIIFEMGATKGKR